MSGNVYGTWKNGFGHELKSVTGFETTAEAERDWRDWIMDRKAGKLQKEYVNCLDEMHTVLQEMRELLEKNKVDILLEYRNVITGFGEVLPEVLNIFGYEQKIQEGMCAVEAYGRYQTKEQMTAELEMCDRALNELSAFVDMLLNSIRGRLRVCNCCGEQVYYQPLSDYYRQQNERYHVKPHIPEMLSHEEYTCPSCRASDRDRLMTAFLQKLELDKLVHAEKLLQIAPSEGIEHWIYANCPALIYDSTDYYMENVTFQSDIQNMSMVSDESYDYFICSHVLEHVQDDRKAMKELYRILKDDGIGLFLVPVCLDIERIEEEWGLTEEENWRRFGQGDHCRNYAGAEMTERLEEAGFTVHPLGKSFFGEDVFRECGLTDTSTLYVLTKHPVDLIDFILKRKEKRDVKWEEPLVSVILPCYNHEKYVAESIESVLNQSYHNYEFLVGDDGSTDGTAAEIVKYEDRIDQIHLFDMNMGGKTTCFLLGETKGKYVAMMHSDDLWSSEKLKMQVIYMENHPECGACFTGCVLFNDAGENLGNGPFALANKKKEEWFCWLYDVGNLLAHPSVLIRRDLYIELMFEDGCDRFRQLPDYWRWLKLVQKSEIHIIEKELTFFRWHTEDRCKNVSAPVLENTLRTIVEQSYIRYSTIKNMDGDYFLKAFQNWLKKKAPLNEKEIMCEKFFVLMNTRFRYTEQAAIQYLYEIYAVEGIPELLETQYNFGFQDIYKITGEFLPGVIDEFAASI